MNKQNYGKLLLSQLVELSFTDNDAKEYLIDNYQKNPVTLADEVFEEIENNTNLSEDDKNKLVQKIACLRDIADGIDLKDIGTRQGSFKTAEAIIIGRLKTANANLSF